MNCKYCGAEIAENDLFCPNCGSELRNGNDNAAEILAGEAHIQREIPENETGTTGPDQINCDAEHGETSGGTNADTRGYGTGATYNPQRNNSPEAKQRNWKIPKNYKRILKAAAAILCCAALIGIGYGIHTKSLEGQLRRAKSDYAAAAASVEDLNTQLADAQTALETVQGENDTLTGQVSSLNDQVTTMEGEIAQYQYDVSAAEQNAEYASGQIDTLNDTITGLETDLAAANEANETLQADNDTLTEENGTLQIENETLTEENADYAEKVSFYDQYVVFVMVGDKDKYYHTYDCTEFTKKNFLAYSVKLAELNDYTPCPVCHSGTTAVTVTTSTTAAGTNN